MKIGAVDSATILRAGLLGIAVSVPVFAVAPDRAVFMASILSMGTTIAPWRSAWMRSPLRTAMPCTVTSMPKSTTWT